MERLFYVYILARRVFEHRSGAVKGFTAKYRVKMLVWFEAHPSVVEAIALEKRIKRWRRRWKLALIEEMNPEWLDLYAMLNQ